MNESISDKPYSRRYSMKFASSPQWRRETLMIMEGTAGPLGAREKPGDGTSKETGDTV
jgi:hypothetical protein